MDETQNKGNIYVAQFLKKQTKKTNDESCWVHTPHTI